MVRIDGNFVRTVPGKILWFSVPALIIRVLKKDASVGRESRI
jgi:hypothetical protein